jgi:hypothetical protein
LFNKERITNPTEIENLCFDGGRHLHYKANADGKATMTQFHINSFKDDMASMVSNGLPCPWNDQLALHALDKHVKMLMTVRAQLLVVAAKEDIPTSLDIEKPSVGGTTRRLKEKVSKVYNMVLSFVDYWFVG